MRESSMVRWRTVHYERQQSCCRDNMTQRNDFVSRVKAWPTETTCWLTWLNPRTLLLPHKSMRVGVGVIVGLGLGMGSSCGWVVCDNDESHTVNDDLQSNVKRRSEGPLLLADLLFIVKRWGYWRAQILWLIYWCWKAWNRASILWYLQSIGLHDQRATGLT